MLKAKAKAIATTDDPKKVNKIIFDIEAAAAAEEEDGTFVTGVGIPGAKKKKRKFTKEELADF